MAGPFDEGLAQEFGALKSAMHPALVAAALGDGRDAGVFLQVLGMGVPVALLTEGDQESGSVYRAGTGEVGEEREVFMGLGELGDARIEGFDGFEGDPELGDQGFDQQGMRGNDAWILGQGQGGLDLLDALLNDLVIAHVMLLEEASEGGRARPLDGFQGGPLGKEVAEDDGVFVRKPL